MSDSTKPTRTYSNGDVTVEWRRPLCTHCRACLEGLPEVFDLNARPWVNINGASPDAIREQVADCPSGALLVPTENRTPPTENQSP